MKIGMIILSIILILIGCVAQPTSQAIPPTGRVYYVATSGIDSNPGTITQPWRTIQKAARTMVAGDTVFVTAGDYSTQRVHITKSGVSGSPITYQAQGQVVMKGFNIVANHINIIDFEIANTNYRRWDYETSAGVYIKGAYNTLADNYIHDSSLVGIELSGDNTITHDNIVSNNRLYRNEMAGIEVKGQNNLIEGNEVWRTIQCHPNLTKIEDKAPDNNGKKCPYYPAVSGLDGDGMRFFGQGHIFRGNNIHGLILNDTINGINVNPTPHIDCFQTWSDSDFEVAQNITFEQNYCENYDGSSAIMLSGGANHLYIRNNIFRTATGISANGDGAGGSDYLYIFNNIWAGSLSPILGAYPTALKMENINHVWVENNIFYDQGYVTAYFLGDTSNTIFDYNLTYNSDGTKQHCIEWGSYRACLRFPAHNLLNTNPQFVNPGSKDYHLKSTSSAIDAGVNLGNLVPNDFDGIPRPQGAGYDIGAYEYNSTVSSPTPITTPTGP